MLKSVIHSIVLTIILLDITSAYSPRRDAKIIAEYKKQLESGSKTSNSITANVTELNHAKIARQLVNRASWASVGTISTNNAIKDYPMVNIISVNDNDVNGKSTGHIQFMLTDLDFTGPDWQHNNKATFMFTDEQTLKCTHGSPQKDPMEPTCPRAMFSGQIRKMDTNRSDYKKAIAAFVVRHPAAANWIKVHNFYLCELYIKNIYVLDFYGGPHTVTPDEYYSKNL